MLFLRAIHVCTHRGHNAVGSEALDPLELGLLLWLLDHHVIRVGAGLPHGVALRGNLGGGAQLTLLGTTVLPLEIHIHTRTYTNS